MFALAIPHPVFSQYRHMIGVSYAGRYRSLDSIFLNKGLFSFDSQRAFRMLDTIASLANANDDDELVMEMRLMRCVYYTRGKQANKPACGPCLQSLLGEVAAKNNLQLKARVHTSLSYFYRYDKPDYGRSLQHQLHAYYLVKDMDVRVFPNKMEILSGLGGIYHSFGDYENAKKYMRESIEAGTSYKPWFNINLNSNLGLIYRNEGKYDSAVYYFSKAREAAIADHNLLWTGITGGNIGATYFMQGRYDEAVPLLEYNVEQSLKRDKDNAASALIRLAAIHLHKGETERAKGRLLQARELIKGSGDAYDNLKDLYPLMSKCFAASGNMPLAYKYADSAIAVKDSLDASMNAIVMAKAQQHAEAEKHLAEVQKLDGQRKVQVLWRNGLLIIILLSGVIAILFINRQKIAYSRRQEKLENDKLLMQSDLANATAQLEAFTRSVHEKNELIEKIRGELDQLQQHSTGAASGQHNEILLQLQEATILTEEEWKRFKALFEKVHGGFLNRLREKLPDLSPAEIRFMALSKLKLSNKEMAGILGITTDAVRMNRYRLRKKLNLPDKVDIEELADTV